MTSVKSRMFTSRYGVIGSANAKCNYPTYLKSINHIAVLEDDINKDLQIFFSDECKVFFSKDKLDETDKLKKSQRRLFPQIGVFFIMAFCRK